MPEPDDAGQDHEVPAELVELHEVLEYALAVHTHPTDGADEAEQ